jgi:hypothetical protein
MADLTSRQRRGTGYGRGIASRQPVRAPLRQMSTVEAMRELLPPSA